MSHTPNPDDDYPEVTIAPAPPAPRRPRAQNPAVDEVIHSGEIELPRSLIIRSTTPPPVHREDDRTEPTVRAPTMPTMPSAPPRRFGRLAWLVAALAPGIAALALSYVHAAKPATPRAVEAESIAQLIATTLDGEAHAAQVRAEAIASSSMLRAGIQTDAATLANMAHDGDVVFSLAKGERIEMFQGGSGQTVSLLRVPENAAPVVPPAPGTARLELDHGTVTVVVSAAVTKPGGGTAGVIALAAPVDLARAKGRSYEQISGVALTGFGAPIVLGGGTAAPGGSPVQVPVATTVAKGPALAITATLAAPELANDQLLVYARYACAGLASLFLLMYAASLVVRR